MRYRENLRKCTQSHQCTARLQWKEGVELVSKPTFKRFKIINDSLTMIEMAKTKVTLCKPIYAGFTVLEASKELMFSFHYHEMLTMFPQPDQLRLLFTDTGKL